MQRRTVRTAAQEWSCKKIMAKVKMYICDICGEHTQHYHDIIRIKARSGSFVNIFLKPKSNADLKTFDICTKCADKFKVWRKKEVGNNVQP